MIIVDTALAEREAAGDPIKVALVGAGAMSRAVAHQITGSVPGMVVAAVANRTLANGERLFSEAGIEGVVTGDDLTTAERAIADGRPFLTNDPSLVCAADGIDVVVEITGTISEAARVTLEAIDHGKHVLLMNAEVDGTVGPLLKARADAAGVIVSATDGDQPGVEANLYRYVRSIGLEPLVCGNVKGLQDPYRTPTTQAAFAARWGQTPAMVTSFADGTKISFEQAIVANGFGLRVAQRGMRGGVFTGHVDELTSAYDVDELREHGGVVDYVVGARPAPGVFVFGAHDDPKHKHLLDLYKLGRGPLYSFYTPYHLCHFEVPLSVARVVLFNDPVLQPEGAPRVEVVATAKRDLAAGEVLDGLGGYCTYGECENAGPAAEEDLLPIGVAEGVTVVRDVPRDRTLTYADVELPPGRLVDALRVEQRAHFATA